MTTLQELLKAPDSADRVTRLAAAFANVVIDDIKKDPAALLRGARLLAIDHPEAVDALDALNPDDPTLQEFQRKLTNWLVVGANWINLEGDYDLRDVMEKLRQFSSDESIMGFLDEKAALEYVKTNMESVVDLEDREAKQFVLDYFGEEALLDLEDAQAVDSWVNDNLEDIKANHDLLDPEDDGFVEAACELFEDSLLNIGNEYVLHDFVAELPDTQNDLMLDLHLIDMTNTDMLSAYFERCGCSEQVIEIILKVIELGQNQIH